MYLKMSLQNHESTKKYVDLWFRRAKSDIYICKEEEEGEDEGEAGPYRVFVFLRLHREFFS